MVSISTKEKLARYRDWFKKILIKEFLNLPYRGQEQFIALVESFLKDCRVIHEEGQDILERKISIEISKVEYQKEATIAVCTSTDLIEPVTLRYPPQEVLEEGKKVSHMIYSLDGKNWYSSKKALLKGRG